MKVIHKHIVREVLPPMIISLLIFTFVFLMRTIADLAEKLIEYQYTLNEIARLLMLSIPAIMGYVIPMSILLGIVLGLNRLSADSEIVAMTSGGISTHSFIVPLFGLAFVAWMANTWLLNEAVPMANQAYTEIIIEHSSEVISSRVKPNLFNEDFPGLIIYINDIETRKKPIEWHRIFLFDNRNPDSPNAVFAKKAWIGGEQRSLDLNLNDCRIYTFPSKELGEDPKPVQMADSHTFHLLEGENIDARLEAEKDNRSKTITELLADIRREQNLLVLKTLARNPNNSPAQIEIAVSSAGQVIGKGTLDVPPTGNREANLEKEIRLAADYEKKPLKLTLSQAGSVLIERDLKIADFQQKRFYPITAELNSAGNLQIRNPKLERKPTNSYLIEIHKKFALPFACFIFGMLGLPLGLSSRRGGKAYGYIVGITIFVIYWGLLSTGENMAMNERISPALGIWAPNIFFGLLAIGLLLRRRIEIRVPLIGQFLYRLRGAEEQRRSDQLPSWKAPAKASTQHTEAKKTEASEQALGRALRFPPIIDRYIIKIFLLMFLLVFAVVYAVFSLVQFIDVNNDIQKNRVDPIILLDYFRYAAPDTVRWVIPISALMGTMICFGILSKNSEVTAFKASGISVYRIGAPVIFMAIAISALSFVNLDYILPATASRLAEIKGVIRNRPVQTLRDPINRWILGEDRDSIYYFQQYNDQEKEINELHVFQIDAEEHLLKRRYYSPQVRWDQTSSNWRADEGWLITYRGNEGDQLPIADGQVIPIDEDPSYFGQEIRPSDQMSFAELSNYVETLSSYGLPVTKERFDLYWKLSFPFLPLVMTLLGLPFSFRTARKGGALTGVFISIGLVVIYWGMMSLFRALGQSGLLLPVIAAWAPNIVFLGLGVLLFAAVRS